VELIDQQYQKFQVSNANENDLDNDGQQFGLSYGANQESNLTNEGYAGSDGQQFGLSNGANHGLNLTNEGKLAKI
jgi:hypothetical protein